MTTLSQDRREWLYKVFPDTAAAMIREIEGLPTQEQANKAVTRLKDTLNTQFAQSGLPPSQHPGMAYFGTGFKGMKAQRPAPPLADLIQMQKQLNTRIKALRKAQKDAYGIGDDAPPPAQDAKPFDPFWS